MRKIITISLMIVCLFASLAIGSEVNTVPYKRLDPEVQKIFDDVIQGLLEKHIVSMQRGEWDEIYGGKITWNTKRPKY